MFYAQSIRRERRWGGGGERVRQRQRDRLRQRERDRESNYGIITALGCYEMGRHK